MTAAVRAAPGADGPSAGAFPPGGSWAFALLVVVGTNAAGLALDLALGGRGFPAPAWPWNGVLLAVFLAGLGSFHRLLRGTRLLAGFAGTRLAVITLAALLAWGMVLGTLPQASSGPAPLQARVVSAPPFVLTLLLLASNLVLVLLASAARGLGASSLGLVSHLGLLVALLAGTFGAGDLRRVNLDVPEREVGWIGREDGREVPLPFAIALHRLEIEYHERTLTLVDGATGEQRLEPGSDPVPVRAGATGRIGSFAIEVGAVDLAAPWSAPDDPVPAAWVRAISADGIVAEGWVSAGSRGSPPVFVSLGGAALAMADAKPSLFRSSVTLVTPDESPRELEILVNEPVRLGTWWIYQSGFEQGGAGAPRVSRFEAVRDPWYPVICVGMLLLAIGAVLALARAPVLARRAADAEGGVS